MKTYPIVDLTGNSVLNPGANPGDIYPRPLSWITDIIVHHEAQFRPHDYDSVSRYEQEARYQSKSIPGSRGICYHYHIDNIGTIYHLRPLNQMTWNCGNYPANQHSIAICVDGNFQDQLPTQEQAEALKQLLDYLSTPASGAFPADQSSVYPHQHYTSTACCGANLVGWVNSYRENKGNVPIANNSGYDWAQYQPAPPAPTPVPPPPPATPDYITNATNVNKVVVAKTDVSLVDLTKDQAIKNFPVNTEFSIGRQTTHNGNVYYITQYSASKDVWNGILASQLKDKDASTPTPPATTDTPPPPLDPPPLAPGAPQPTLSDIMKELGIIKGIVAFIKDLLSKIFK